MKALVGAFNQEKALVGAFSVIVKPVVEPMDRFTALVWTNPRPYLLCSLVLTVSRGKREMSTAMPAMPPDTREVRKLGSLITGYKRYSGWCVSISEMKMI